MRDSLNREVQKAAGDIQLLAQLSQVRDARDPAAARAWAARRYFLNVSPKKSPLFQVGLPGASAMSRPML